jgi:hypothetical protein
MVQNNYVWTSRGVHILEDPPPPVLPYELRDLSYYNARIEHPYGSPGQEPAPQPLPAAHLSPAGPEMPASPSAPAAPPVPAAPAAPAALVLTDPSRITRRSRLARSIIIFIVLVVIVLIIVSLALDKRYSVATKLWMFLGIMMGLLAVCLTIAWFHGRLREVNCVS